MMTDEHIKEALSIRYIELLAAYNGYKSNTSYPDYGTDVEIKEVDFRMENERKRYFDTGRELKFQLKSTTENSISIDNDYVRYDIPSSTYNNMIYRKHTKYPLILIIYVLPLDRNNWLNISDESLIARKCAFWYLPEHNAELTENTSSIRIAISKSNLLTNESLNQLFEEYS